MGQDTDDQNNWRVLSARELLHIPGRARVTVEAVELPGGRVVDDYVQVALNDFVVILAETENAETILLRMYRHGARRSGLELPAGCVDDGEEPLHAAKRELLEETGYVSERWEALGSYVLSGTQGGGTGHLFRAYDAMRVQEPSSGDLEIASVETVSAERLRRAIRGHEFLTLSHLATIAAAKLG